MRPPPRPFYLRAYVAPLLVLLPGTIAGEAVRRITCSDGWAALTSLAISGLAGAFVLNAWHRHCARYNHRPDL